MSDRTVEFEENAICDICGARGALDFLGDYRCIACLSSLNEDGNNDPKFTAPRAETGVILVDDGECACYLAKSSLPNMASLAFRDGGGFSSCLIDRDHWEEMKKRGDEFFEKMHE